ncbi:hypothetical protein IQ250_20895 [Pseudanabaenaceae cyanobacterium LEGE 13415]|nr:hypothetical protein [Pseudanabaenaceae cyanobacterium LEGE 13415]
MAKKSWYIKVNDAQNIWYEFTADENAYPEALGIALGVSTVLPTGGVPTRRGTFANYPIVRVRIKLQNGESRTRLCDMDMLQTAMTDLIGTALFGSTVKDVLPVRRNLLL